MKTILCYGDSNTWGSDPGGGARFDPETRWPGVLRRALGDGYRVIEEGLGGRTTVWNDPIEGYKNGKEYLIPCLDTHQPLDLVIIMLGTNDLKHRFSLTAFDIAQGAGVLVEVVQNSRAGRDAGPPRVLLLAPPPVATLHERFQEMFKGAAAKSRQFGKYYRQVAAERGCDLLDTAELVRSSELDGIHLEPGEHAKLGLAVAERVRLILPD
ncbi:lysophospholipase L1-like esterase [Hydrogenispora ethanolica]|uniref:Lysophospholipase L1-like esterase n=1 Tax=Hydrogenispora ethanolica TaxID=1082276 RepID=A0A4R1SBV7_HYDET|nr:SGNH/GDSL hydrolase family protein [Hydrogenispora ethanolica]TCL76774.1 lysophospholipase L1-like esterase [Hydrogenispora ethanolica]